MFYKWTDSMSVGVPLIDNDHQALIALINTLHDRLAAEPDGLMEALLDQLIGYVEIHFTREERMMEACGYPEIDEHKEEHAAFADYIGDLRVRFADAPAAELAAELAEFLKGWLNHHILIQDMAYRPYAAGNAAAARAAEAFGPGLSDRLPTLSETAP